MRGSAAGAVVTASIAECAQPTHAHSLAKVFSWRVMATATTALIAFAITSEIDTALLIGGIGFFLKFWHLLPARAVLVASDLSPLALVGRRLLLGLSDVPAITSPYNTVATLRFFAGRLRPK